MGCGIFVTGTYIPGSYASKPVNERIPDKINGGEKLATRKTYEDSNLHWRSDV
jgi:hypothetical protein